VPGSPEGTSGRPLGLQPAASGINAEGSQGGETMTSGETSSSHEATSTSAVGGPSSSAPGRPTGGALPFTGAGTPALHAVGLALVDLGVVTLLPGLPETGR
jgi:hypothetical protein